jgi:zinc transporter ZupT
VRENTVTTAMFFVGFHRIADGRRPEISRDSVLRTLTIIAVILPLAIDTFVLSTALGVAGLANNERFRTSLLLTAFEAGMPVVGFVVGAGLGSFIGQRADYLAAAVLAGTGAWMLWPGGSEEEEEERKGSFPRKGSAFDRSVDRRWITAGSRIPGTGRY